MEHIQFIHFQDYMQYYFSSQRKLNVNGNLASLMMLHAPPTSASLFWFYYRTNQIILKINSPKPTKEFKQPRSVFVTRNLLPHCKDL